MKYRPGYPEVFESAEEAKKWVKDFVDWYNYDHKHSGIKFQTPNDRHTGEVTKKAVRRAEVYEQAKKRNPERWGSRKTRNWGLPHEVWLNPDNSGCDKANKVAA